MLEYYKKFTGIICQLSAEDIKWLVLKVMSLIYPLLARYGASLGGPLLVHVPDEETASKAVNFLRGYARAKINPLGASTKQFEKALGEIEYGIMFVSFSDTRYTMDNLQKLCVFCYQARFERRPQPLVFVISPRAVPAGMQSAFAGTVYLGDVDYKEIWDDKLTRPFITALVDHQKILEAKIGGLVSKELQVVRAAVEAFKFFLFVEGVKEEELKEVDTKFEEACRGFLRDWSSENDPEILGEVFVDWVFDWLFSQEEQPLFLNRKNAGRTAQDLPGSAWFYDELAYYVPDADFTAICEPFASEVGISYLKRALEIAGILGTEGNNRSYRTVTVWIKGSNGSLIKRRCVKLWRDKLDASTDISLFEYLKGGILDNE